MTALSRRRLLTIAAGSGALAFLRPPHALAQAAADGLHVWRGTAMGAGAMIALDHPEAAEISRAVANEIARLEAIFSLHLPQSALARLNASGRLDAPPAELRDCLALAGVVHRASGGVFDPTVQPLWALHAESHSATGGPPTREAVARTLARTGWSRLSVAEGAIEMAPGMALTLNGIAQGYVADRVTALLQARGLDEVLIETGELRAIGGQPGGAAWPVQLAGGGSVGLRDRALATSAAQGTSFDVAGRIGHIIDPRTGRSAGAAIAQTSVSARSAALADALSTAIILLPDRSAAEALVGAFADARLEALRLA